MFYTDIESLLYPLPEDILKLKGYGDYARLQRVIELRLQDDKLPGALKARLRMEREMAARIPESYPYSFEAALALLQAELQDYTAEEFERDRDMDRADWIYVNGEVRFHEDFFSTMVKVRPELAPRLIHPERLEGKLINQRALDEVIAEMQANGGAARRYHLKHTLRLKEEFVRLGRTLRVHLPLPLEVAYATNFHLLSAGPGAPQISGNAAAQRTAYFEVPAEDKQEFHVEYTFEVRMPYASHAAEAARRDIPEEVRTYLSEQLPHIAFTHYLRAVAGEIAGEEQNPLLLARRTYDFLTKQPTYSFVRNYFTYPNLPEYMLTSMKGDCGIFALAFITLMRIMGVPARWQSGLYCAPHDVGCHDWAEFYCAPWGWLPVDVSFGNAAWRAGSALRHEFYFGHLEPFRLPAAQEFQKPFDPPKRHLRSDPYDNQMGEAEYDDMPLYQGTHFLSDVHMISWEKLAI